VSRAGPAARPGRRFRVHPVTWIGLAVLVVGVGPLVAILLAARLGWTADPNPNPIGPGIAAFLSFWPGIAMLSIGLVLSFMARREVPPPPRRGPVGTTPPIRPDDEASAG
jgi:hypothetical protein